MIELVRFKNFRALRDAVLPLGPFTLIVGPNASGKSTALRALTCKWQEWRDASTDTPEEDKVELVFTLSAPPLDGFLTGSWNRAQGSVVFSPAGGGGEVLGGGPALQWLRRARLYALSPDSIVSPVQLQPHMELAEDGGNLAGVLDRLRDTHPERFEALNAELQAWLPEFDRVLFDTPTGGKRAFALRTRAGHHAIPAVGLSHGTVLALAILTIAYLPDPPPLVCIEEPEHGLHPRLFRDVQDAMYRLSHPEKFGEQRPPVQVVATTHSPYLLDLYREQPEEVVIGQKIGGDARFERLSDRPDLGEILEGAHLGDVWYSGILGGVPTAP